MGFFDDYMYQLKKFYKDPVKETKELFVGGENKPESALYPAVAKAYGEPILHHLPQVEHRFSKHTGGFLMGGKYSPQNILIDRLKRYVVNTFPQFDNYKDAKFSYLKPTWEKLINAAILDRPSEELKRDWYNESKMDDQRTRGQSVQYHLTRKGANLPTRYPHTQDIGKTYYDFKGIPEEGRGPGMYRTVELSPKGVGDVYPRLGTMSGSPINMQQGQFKETKLPGNRILVEDLYNFDLDKEELKKLKSGISRLGRDDEINTLAARWLAALWFVDDPVLFRQVYQEAPKDWEGKRKPGHPVGWEFQGQNKAPMPISVPQENYPYITPAFEGLVPAEEEQLLDLKGY